MKEIWFSIHSFPSGSFTSTRKLPLLLLKFKKYVCHSQCKKKWQKRGMQNRSRSLSSGAVLTVHSCSYSGRKLNNLLQMQCFNHKLLLRKECSCVPPLTTPQNARQKRSSGYQHCIFHSLNSLLVC